MEDVKPYKTSDTALASYLVTKGMKILGTVPHEQDEKRKVFIFADHSDRDKWVEEYLTGDDQVSASLYARTYKVTKRFLYDDQP